MEDSVFTKMLKGEIPSYKVYEDDDYMAILTNRPKAPGHLLIIPKKQVDYIFDLDDETYHGLFTVAKKLDAPLRRATGAGRLFLAVEGLEVPHVHLHIIPGTNDRPLEASNEFSATPEEFKEMQEKILKELEG